MTSSVFGLLGRRLGHSWSPQIHSVWGIGDYALFEREPEDVPAFLASEEWAGLNVTIPYKKTVMPYCDTLSETARRIGAVNTIVRTKDGLFGDNTDYAGFLFMLRSAGFSVSGKKVLILGTGGAAVTARAVIEDEGGFPVFISRRGKNNYTNLSRHADAELVVNATPVGMYPENGLAPLSLEVFNRPPAVADMIYNPCRTALMMEAKRLGAPCVGGLTMLAAQARRSAELFLGHALPDELVTQAVRTVTGEMRNIVLIGMPGAGKTTVGKQLAALLGHPFVDTDEEIARQTGRTPAEILRADGEDAFRAVESEVLRKVGKELGQVIACGGGVVTRAENLAPLRQNGKIFLLLRPLAELAVQGRPLSGQYGTEALWAARRERYLAWADATVTVRETSAETAREILTLWEARHC